jgi:hypothetical protein
VPERVAGVKEGAEGAGDPNAEHAEIVDEGALAGEGGQGALGDPGPRERRRQRRHRARRSPDT